MCCGSYSCSTVYGSLGGCSIGVHITPTVTPTGTLTVSSDIVVTSNADDTTATSVVWVGCAQQKNCGSSPLVVGDITQTTITVDGQTTTCVHGPLPCSCTDKYANPTCCFLSRPSYPDSASCSTPAKKYSVGPHAFSVKVDTYDGDVGSYSGAFTVIDTPPSVSVTPSPASPDSTQTVTFSASATDDVGLTGELEIFFNGAKVKGCPASGTSASCSYTGGPYSPGSYSYSAQVKDTKGQTGSYSSTLTVSSPPFDFSISSPSPPSGTVERGDSVTTSVDMNLLAGSTQPVTITCSGISGVTCTGGCSPTCMATVTITTSPTATLGTNTLTVTASGGGKTKTTAYALTIQDTAKPIITVLSPLEPKYLVTSVWANATLNEEGMVWMSLDGGPNVTLSNSTGNWNNQMTGLSYASHTVTFYANDTSDNNATPVTKSFLVSKSCERIIITKVNALPGDNVTTKSGQMLDIELTVDGSACGPVTKTIYLKQKPPQGWSWAFQCTPPLTDCGPDGQEITVTFNPPATKDLKLKVDIPSWAPPGNYRLIMAVK